MRAVLALCALMLLIGASDQPTPAPPKAAGQPKKNTSERQTRPEPDKRATSAQPAVVELFKAPVIQVETTDKPEKSRDYTDHEWWLVYLTGLLAAITGTLAWYTARLYRSTKKIAGDSEKAATNSISLTRATERAYIKMSHAPPGFEFIPGGKVKITSEVKNWGSTPGSVTYWSLWLRARKAGTPIPEDPEYGTTPDESVPRAFLVTKESVHLVNELPVGQGWIDAIQSGANEALVVGYVDYRDQFGGRYRGGYARYFVPAMKRNNLHVVTKRGYNYDRKREKGEGDDWGDE